MSRLHESGINAFTLSMDFLMCMKRKHSTIIDLDNRRISAPLDGGMVCTVEWYIVCGCLQARDSDTLDLTKAARILAIVAFHLHHQRDCRNVTKDRNEICMQD